MDGELWVEPVFDIIIARMRGMPTERLLRECQNRIQKLVKEMGTGRILYDCLEMEPPADNVPVSQWKLDEEFNYMRLRRAVVVPNTKIAYLGRLAFGEHDTRIFYNDMSAAVSWLSGTCARAQSLPPLLQTMIRP